ncbi:MAG: penicillin-binding transpeptidase domain-containing protein [Pyrinomonadaceae bacterium]
MKLLCPKYFASTALLVFSILALASTGSVAAQSKSKANAKKAVAKKAETRTKDAKNSRDNKKVTAKKDDKKEKLTAKERAKREAEAKKEAKLAKKDPKKARESKQEAAERRRREEERRLAILAEQRRREQARREAIARALAFERGLRTETVANILNDKTDGEDLRIRSAAINALGKHAGSVVVMEAQTGKVLTIVNQDWAIRSSIRPCSTIKLVTGAAGVNEGVISRETGLVRNTRTRRDLDDALAFSDNPYFQRAGVLMGNDKLVEYGQKLGLGQQTGINLEGEVTGRLPYNNKNARIYSHGDDTEVTTIQLAVMAAAITNGGHRVLPRIPRNNIEKASFKTFYRANVDLPQQSVRRVIPGMMGAAEYGTARRGVDQSQGVAGKTGSCIDKGSWVGLFASVAPVEKPKYAVAVITRGQRERGKYAAAIAGQIYRALGTQIVRTDRNLAQNEFNIKPKYDARTAAQIASAADEEVMSDENSDVADNEIEGRPVIVVPNAVVQPSRKRLVTKTVSSRPLFPPVIITFDRDGKEQKTAPRSKSR